ncbi:hypothetical protein K491DRAFT_712612 [Lophiostoma macrostomum CBS 122681]|uniref:Pentapeptide repeat-containing protein n=1 Tax=Lophiostoma macrostomum CBS 122681 TaxID=1314788 RepID=A0A6A6THU1_9PLEO|nr:hypothetical protein K491DRAFT_712612 [Lophiostoma macrostomum CBS 122681]
MEHLEEHNWINQPFQKRTDPCDWVKTKSHPDIARFSNVAVGLLFQHPDFKMRPKLVALAKKSLHEVWAALWLATMRDKQERDWISHWDEVLEICARIFDGYPVETFPLRIPANVDQLGNRHINWTIPYRSVFSMPDCRLDGWNATYTGLRAWNLKASKCLVANSTWTGIIFTRCTFERCTFRDTQFNNVHFLDCHFVDADFKGVELKNTFISKSSMHSTLVAYTTLSSVSWCHNSFVGCTLEGIKLTGTIWTYIQYTNMKIVDCASEDASEHWVRRGGEDTDTEEHDGFLIERALGRISIHTRV